MGGVWWEMGWRGSIRYMYVILIREYFEVKGFKSKKVGVMSVEKKVWIFELIIR